MQGLAEQIEQYVQNKSWPKYPATDLKNRLVTARNQFTAFPAASATNSRDLPAPPTFYEAYRHSSEEGKELLRETYKAKGITKALENYHKIFDQLEPEQREDLISLKQQPRIIIVRRVSKPMH